MNRGVTEAEVEAAARSLCKWYEPDPDLRVYAGQELGVVPVWRCFEAKARACITAALAAEPGAAEGTIATLVEREDDAIITVPHWQWGKMAIARRPKAMSNEQWRPFANRIIAALAAAPHPSGESGK